MSETGDSEGASGQDNGKESEGLWKGVLPHYRDRQRLPLILRPLAATKNPTLHSLFKHMAVITPSMRHAGPGTCPSRQGLGDGVYIG